MDKKCSKCKEIKDISCFYRNKNETDGHGYYCKPCMRSYGNQWEKNNRAKMNQHHKKWVHANKDKVRQSHKQWYEKNKQYEINRVKQWQDSNPEKTCAYKRKYDRSKRQTPKGKVDDSMSSAVYLALISQKSGRKWEDLVGYNVEDLIVHLETQFDENMNWINYGTYWHIDHIKPKSRFNYGTPEDDEFIQCWALENLQPLEATQNLQKGSKISWPI